MGAEHAIAVGFERAGCTGSLHVLDLTSGGEICVRADEPVVLASVLKILVALEFCDQAHSGAVDPARTVRIEEDARTAGPTGISMFDDLVEVSLRDLCRLMMTVSDNTATDILIAEVGLDRVNERARACGCHSTVIESDLRTLIDGIGADLGFTDYAQLLAAQSGALGPEARERGHDAARIDACAALDPLRTTRSTPREMSRLLSAIWKDEAASPRACADLRALMAQQVSSRLARALPDRATLASKTGSLLGRIRNEVGVITHEDGRAFAVSVFTRAHRPFEGVSQIETEMAVAAASSIEALRR
ncbi:MAG: serine hydrolase [Caulobacteraceae bacterium]|nr:serine hydrolase [Caulobacteraceae bacterium]